MINSREEDQTKNAHDLEVKRHIWEMRLLLLFAPLIGSELFLRCVHQLTESHLNGKDPYILNTKGTVEAKKGFYSEAIASYSSAFELMLHLEKKDESLFFALCVNLTHALQSRIKDSQNPDEAKANLELALSIVEKNAHEPKHVFFAIQQILRPLVLADTFPQKDTRRILTAQAKLYADNALALGELGSILSEKKLYNESLEYMIDSMIALKSVQDTESEKSRTVLQLNLISAVRKLLQEDVLPAIQSGRNLSEKRKLAQWVSTKLQKYVREFPDDREMANEARAAKDLSNFRPNN